MRSIAFESPEPKSGVVAPSGDLYSDEPEMESYLHLVQMIVLLSSLDLFWQRRTDYFAAGNLTIYYSPRQLKSEHFRGPDFFVVLGTERRPRKSWVVWEEEGKYPNLIVEVLSSSTAAMDRGLKKQIYQDIFRTPDYFWFDPETLELAGFHLVDGRYEPLVPDAAGRLWSSQLELWLGVHGSELRLFTREGELLPAGKELLEQAAKAERRTANAERRATIAARRAAHAEQEAASAEQRAAHAEQEAASAEQRAALLAGKLRELGVDPDAVK